MRLEEQLQCEGFNGFGAGYAVGKANTPDGQVIEGKDLYCNTCPVGQQCWFKHRARVQLIAPKGAKAFDALCAKLGDQFEAMRQWQKRYRILDPYTLWAKANFDSGVSVARTGKLKDMGRWTLGWRKPE